MEMIEKFDINYYLNTTQSEDQLKTEFKSKSKVGEYFEHIYAYPPKIKIKWEATDHLNDTLFSDLKRFKNFFLFAHKNSKSAISENYSPSQYLDGFVDKINSSISVFSILEDS